MFIAHLDIIFLTKRHVYQFNQLIDAFDMQEMNSKLLVSNVKKGSTWVILTTASKEGMKWNIVWFSILRKISAKYVKVNKFWAQMVWSALILYWTVNNTLKAINKMSKFNADFAKTIFTTNKAVVLEDLSQTVNYIKELKTFVLNATTDTI